LCYFTVPENNSATIYVYIFRPLVDLNLKWHTWHIQYVVHKIENVPYFPLLKLAATAYLIKQVEQTTTK